MLKQRSLLEPGYKAFNGHIFTKSQCDQYNIIQDRINAFIKDNIPAPRELFNTSHKVYCEIIGLR